MKIVYRYIFNVTKALARGELMPFVFDFIEKNKLNYKNILFDLNILKYKSSKRKSYLEKLAEEDSFWLKTEAPLKFDKLTNIVSLAGEYTACEAEAVAAKLAKPMAEMPKGCSYKICFDGVSWFCGSDVSEKADFGKNISPLTSNITFYNYAYDGTSYIALNFVMNENGGAHTGFVKAISASLDGLIYEKETFFVPDEAEKEAQKKAVEETKKFLESRKYVKIPLQSTDTGKKSTLKIKASIKKVFHDFNFVCCGGDGYEVWKTDAYHNKLSVVFDYDRENHSFMAALFYIGADIKDGIQYSEVTELYGNDVLLDYIERVREDVCEFERSYAPKLAEYYPKLPNWFEW